MWYYIRLIAADGRRLDGWRQLSRERIESLVDELEGIIEEAKPPFGKSAQFKVIETEVFFNILDEIRMSYPEEWQKSRRILKERDELMASATAQADSIIADAQQQALTIAGEQEIVRLAQQQADDIRERAQQYERETRYAAEDYAEAGLHASRGEPEEPRLYGRAVSPAAQ